MSKPWGGQAAKRGNLYLSAGTIDIAATTSTRGRQQEAFTAAVSQIVPCVAAYAGWPAPKQRCTFLWPQPADHPLQHPPVS